MCSERQVMTDCIPVPVCSQPLSLLLHAGETLKLPATQHLAVAVHGTFPWLWPWADASDCASAPGPTSAPDSEDHSLERASAI